MMLGDVLVILALPVFGVLILTASCLLETIQNFADIIRRRRVTRRDPFDADDTDTSCPCDADNCPVAQYWKKNGRPSDKKLKHDKSCICSPYWESGGNPPCSPEGDCSLPPDAQGWEHDTSCSKSPFRVISDSEEEEGGAAVPNQLPKKRLPSWWQCTKGDDCPFGQLFSELQPQEYDFPRGVPTCPCTHPDFTVEKMDGLKEHFLKLIMMRMYSCGNRRLCSKPRAVLSDVPELAPAMHYYTSSDEEGSDDEPDTDISDEGGAASNKQRSTTPDLVRSIYSSDDEPSDEDKLREKFAPVISELKGRQSP